MQTDTNKEHTEEKSEVNQQRKNKLAKIKNLKYNRVIQQRRNKQKKKKKKKNK